MDILNDFDAESLCTENHEPLKSYKIYGNELNIHSNEVYFGRTSPLSIILMNYSTKLKELIGDQKIKYNFKSKEFVDKIKTLCDNFGKDVAAELNVEKCTFLILLDKESNAFCLPLITCFDNRPVDKDGNPIDGRVDLDKYVDIENIVQTKTGYRFKRAKNKLLFVNINIGLIWESSPEEIAGIICHELGHCFQQGIFGSYKNYSDLLYQNEIKNLNQRFSGFAQRKTTFGRFIALLFPFPGFCKVFTNFIMFVFNPSALNFNLFTKFNKWIHSKVHGRIDEKTFKMDDAFDKNDNIKLSKLRKIHHHTYSNDIDRREAIKEEVDNAYKDYKKINLYKDNNAKPSENTEIKKEAWKFFDALAFDLNNHQENFFNIISLSKFAQNSYAKQVFYRKYEFFADIFASAYGFGPQLYKSIIHTEAYYENYVYDTIFAKGLYKIPIIKAIAFYGNYMRSRDYVNVDEHGEGYQRSSAMYTNLMAELKNNPDLTPEQKKAIEEDCKMYKKIDDEYYEKCKKDGFLYKLYNKMLRKKTTTTSKKVEDLVLGPILELAAESNKKK